MERRVGEGRELDRQILRLALPVVATLLTEPLYELTDTAILGRLGAAELGGAALATVVLGLGQAVFIFLMFGTTATVARLLGSGRRPDAAEAGVQALWLGAAIGTAAAVVLWAAAPALLGWFGADGAVADSARTYFTLSLPGLPAFLVVMAATGYLRGRQDTRTPLYVAMGTVSLNLVVEVIAIFGLGFGVGASALSTVLAKWTGALVLGGFVIGDGRRLAARLRPHRATLGRLGRTAAPLFVRTLALRAVVAAAAGLAGAISADVLAGYAIGFAVWMTLAYLVEALEVAAQALVARALGAADAAGARRTARRVLGWCLAMGLATGLVLFWVREPLAGLFTDDASVAAVAGASLAWVAVMQPLNAVAFGLDGILVGAGDLWFMAAVMLVAAGAFGALAATVGTRGQDVGAVWAVVGAFMAVRAAGLGLRYVAGGWAGDEVTARNCRG